MLKYTIMRIRSKISFSALQKKQVFLELMIQQILLTFNMLVDVGYYEMNEDKLRLENNIIIALGLGHISLLKVMTSIYADRYLRGTARRRASKILADL